MRSHALTRLSLIAALSLSLAACGVGKRQSPVGSDDEAGLTKPVQIEEEKPSIYVTKTGDSLRAISGRQEIYGEPDLWPLILDANVDALGAQTGRSKLAMGISLSIFRGQDEAAKADAREKARQANAVAKAQRKPRSMEPAFATHSAPATRVSAKPVPTVVANPVHPKASANPVAKPVAEAAKPVPKVKKSGGLLPVLFFLLLLLAILAAVLFYFTKRDQKDAEG